MLFINGTKFIRAVNLTARDPFFYIVYSLFAIWGKIEFYGFGNSFFIDRLHMLIDFYYVIVNSRPGLFTFLDQLI